MINSALNSQYAREVQAKIHSACQAVFDLGLLDHFEPGYYIGFTEDKPPLKAFYPYRCSTLLEEETFTGDNYRSTGHWRQPKTKSFRGEIMFPKFRACSALRGVGDYPFGPPDPYFDSVRFEATEDKIFRFGIIPQKIPPVGSLATLGADKPFLYMYRPGNGHHSIRPGEPILICSSSFWTNVDMVTSVRIREIFCGRQVKVVVNGEFGTINLQKDDTLVPYSEPANS